MSRGRSLELYFVDGTPDGILTAEVFGWTGHVLRIPRLRLAEGLMRREAGHTGAYILLGEVDGRARAYVGEAERVAKRIKDHDAGKEWWDEAVLVTTTADNLHKAHVRYLEARLVAMAKAAGAATLDNGNTPGSASLTEAQVATMEEFLDTLQMILPALGVGLFETGRQGTPVSAPKGEGEIVVFHLETKKNDVKGRARLSGSDFIVLAGSRARWAWEGKGEHDFGYRKLHETLVRAGVLQVEGGNAEFLEDYAFNSPSAAAAVMNGRPANGSLEWRVEGTGETFGAREERLLSALAP